MTFILNKRYGGWSLSDFAVEKLGLPDGYPYLSDELVTKIAALIEEYGSEKISGTFAKLKVVTIPDNYTDFEVNEYDGVEELTYVVDGKIYHA